MAKTHSKDTVVKIDASAGGALTDIKAHITSVDYGRSLGLPDSTTFGDTAVRRGVPGLADNQVRISGFYDPAASQIDEILGTAQTDTETRTLELSFAGTTAGNPKYTGEVWVEEYRPSSQVGSTNLVGFTATLTGDDAFTRASH